MEATRFDPQTMVIDPPHFKKVIYLDQFAISEMVKAIDTRSKSHARVKQVWRQVFEALERVCKQQLVVCPWSPIHRDESLVSEMFEPLKRMYEHLGNGVGFFRSTEIELRQTNMALVAWLDGKAQPNHDLNPERITTGSLHRWQGRYLVTVSMNHPPEQVSGLRQRRTRLNRSLARWFDECRQRTDKSFDHALRIEFEGYRDVLLGAYRDALNRGNELLRQYEAATGEALPSHIENVAPPVGPGSEQVWLILEVLKGRGIAKGEIAKILSCGFLRSASRLCWAIVLPSATRYNQRDNLQPALQRCRRELRAGWKSRRSLAYAARARRVRGGRGTARDRASNQAARHSRRSAPHL